MADDATEHETSTRRDYMNYGGTIVGSGLLAGCLGGNTESDNTISSGTDEATSTDGEPESEDSSDSVTMEPMGTIAFDKPPETWLAFLSTYGDMGIALGKADGLRGLWDPETMPSELYDALPGVDVSFEDVTPIAENGEFDKEIFYELDCDVHLVDPNWLGVLNDNWTDDDIKEISSQVGPFLGNYIRRRGDEWHDYRYYSLYEAFEIVAEAFNETERYEALATVHDEMQASIDDSLPPTEDRPTVGLVSVNSDFEAGSFYAYPVQEGNNHKQYRDLEMRGAFDDHIERSNAEWDYEQLLEVDPDAIVFQYGFSHVSEAEFESRLNTMREDSVGRQLTAVQTNRLYRGGGSYQGPIVNLFQTEAAARQFYPEVFGEWNGVETLGEETLTLFDRQQVADIINGDV